jgi:uncharacterized protein (DUF1684 family)
MTVSDLTDFRQKKDEFFASDHHAPLTPEQQHAFSGLRYYDENRHLKFTLGVSRFEKPEVIELQLSTGEVTSYQRWGRIEFEVEGEPTGLTLFKDAESGEFFLPFVDATNGKETYGAGRYVEVQELGGDRILVDFNYAYNPFCAYNEEWACPLTPFENRLKVPIRAGETNFKPG